MNLITTLVTTFTSFIKTLLSILWLSVSSSSFYQRVYKDYQGYGLKYLLTIAAIAALFYSIIVLNRGQRLVAEINNVTESGKPNNINYIINQIPDMEYDGQTITIADPLTKDSLIIKDINDNKIIAIDPDNKLLPRDKIYIPILINSTATIISTFWQYDVINAKFSSYKDSSISNFDVGKINVPHVMLVGNDPRKINSESIKNILINLLQPNIMKMIYVYLFLLACVIVAALLFSPIIVFIILLYFIMKIYYPKVTMKACIRSVLFANGVIILITPITLLIPAINVGLLQLWPSFLMVSGIVREVKKTPKPPKNIFH